MSCVRRALGDCDARLIGARRPDRLSDRAVVDGLCDRPADRAPKTQDGVVLAMLVPGLAATIALAGASHGALLDQPPPGRVRTPSRWPALRVGVDRSVGGLERRRGPAPGSSAPVGARGVPNRGVVSRGCGLASGPGVIRSQDRARSPRGSRARTDRRDRPARGRGRRAALAGR
jgi:hypothetical protein